MNTQQEIKKGMGAKLKEIASFYDKRDSAVDDIRMCFEWYNTAVTNGGNHPKSKRSAIELRTQLDEAIKRLVY